MDIRDSVFGSIPIDLEQVPIIDSRFFQRLRLIKQLGFSENSFPSATHNRYIHSIGAMRVATTVFDTVFKKIAIQKAVPTSSFEPFRQVLRLAALLHDIGHGPLSHTTEFAMPLVKDLRIPLHQFNKKNSDRQATHEDYTLKILLDSDLTREIENLGLRYGFRPIHVAAIINSTLSTDDPFFQLLGIDFRTVLQQMVSSEVDADRMDYLRRDSLNAGVSYGQFDLDWLVKNLNAHIKEGKCYLALEHKALYAFEDFLISRFHMFLMVYFHHRSVVYDEMLAQYFASPDCSYHLPSQVDHYCETNDSQLMAHLATSSNSWAQRIVQRRPFLMLMEIHSGIPSINAKNKQEQVLAEVEASLQRQQIPWLRVTSTGELSKYFGKAEESIYVRYDNHYSEPSFISLTDCTDLFERFGEKRTITRLYVSPENLVQLRKLGRLPPLEFN